MIADSQAAEKSEPLVRARFQPCRKGSKMSAALAAEVLISLFSAPQSAVPQITKTWGF
jgi:hypothetical protein